MSSVARTNFPQAVVITYLFILGAIFAAPLFPELRLWGLNWYRYSDWYIGLATAAVAVVLPAVLLRWQRKQDQSDVLETPGRDLSRALLFLIIIGFGAAFYFFRTQTLFLGDGYQLLSRLETGGPPIRPWNPGVYMIQDLLYRLLPGSGPATALFTFRVISWVAGGIFSLAVVVTSGYLYHAWYDRLLFCLGALTGGYALLFFGYVENYPLFVLCVGLFALSGLLVLRGKLGRYWPIVPMVLGGLFHPFAVIMLPGCAYLLFRDSRLVLQFRTDTRRARNGVIVAMVAVLVAAGYYAYTQSYFLRFALVPLVEDQFTVEGYTLFSLKHLADWFNLLFVLAPTLPLFVVVFFYRPIRKWLKRPDILFLILMIVPSLAITFLFDPKLGMPRDWDVFAFAGVPLTMIFYGATLGRDGPPNGPRLAILGIALSLLILAPRVAIQAQPDQGIALFDSYAALDKLKSRSGRFILRDYLEQNGQEEEAERRRLRDNRLLPQESWDIEGRAYFGRGQIDSAMAKFRQAIRFDPSFYLSWANLGVAYTSLGQNDSALACLKIADGLMPYNPDNYNNLGGVYYSMGDFDQAEAIWKKAVDLSPRNLVAVEYLMRLYKMQNRTREYDSIVGARQVGASQLEVIDRDN